MPKLSPKTASSFYLCKYVTKEMVSGPVGVKDLLGNHRRTEANLKQWKPSKVWYSCYLWTQHVFRECFRLQITHKRDKSRNPKIWMEQTNFKLGSQNFVAWITISKQEQYLKTTKARGICTASDLKRFLGGRDVNSLEDVTIPPRKAHVHKSIMCVYLPLEKNDSKCMRMLKRKECRNDLMP